MAVRRSQLAGQRAAVVMNLVQSAKVHGHDPWACLNDVLTRLPTHLNGRIDELLPHNGTRVADRTNDPRRARGCRTMRNAD